MPSLEMRKQISIFISLSDWKAIRAEAARQRIPMTELCRRWLSPGLRRLHRAGPPRNATPAAEMNLD